MGPEFKGDIPMSEAVVIVDSIRTGLAKAHRGTFNLTRSDDLVAHCIDALLARTPAVDPAEIDDLILNIWGGAAGFSLMRSARRR